MAIKVLICDDSSFFRRVMTRALAAFPGVEVVGSAPNGRLALQRVKELQPDLMTLDMEMPEMSGLEVLDALRRSGDRVIVIVVSALTRRGGQLTLQALEKGAFDFITKPEAGEAGDSLEALRSALKPRLNVLAQRLEVRRILTPPAPASRLKPPGPVVPGKKPHLETAGPGRPARLPLTTQPEMILIGVSTGGPNALAGLLSRLPGHIGVPVFIVQHMPPVFTASLAENLSHKSPLRVTEAAHLEVAVPNTVYIAPGGKQMGLVPGSPTGITIQITDDPPENNCRPSADYLFRSAARHFPGRSTAVIMTGMGNDGCQGLVLLKQRGCYVIAQDEATSVVYGMPKAAVDAGVVDVVLPLDQIAAQLTSTVLPGRR